MVICLCSDHFCCCCCCCCFVVVVVFKKRNKPVQIVRSRLVLGFMSKYGQPLDRMKYDLAEQSAFPNLKDESVFQWRVLRPNLKLQSQVKSCLTECVTEFRSVSCKRRRKRKERRSWWTIFIQPTLHRCTEITEHVPKKMLLSVVN